MSAERVNPKIAVTVTRKTLRGNVCLLSRVSVEGGNNENRKGELTYRKNGE